MPNTSVVARCSHRDRDRAGLGRDANARTAGDTDVVVDNDVATIAGRLGWNATGR
jgi:hypothetical protein